MKRSFGLSTYQWHNQRLSRTHLGDVGAAGFDAVELFASRRHLDYHNPANIADFQGWLAEAGLTLCGVHAPIAEAVWPGRYEQPWNLAASDPAQRAVALSEAERALQIARRIPFPVFVVQLAFPRASAAGRSGGGRLQPDGGENSRDGARRSVEALQRAAEPLGVRLALKVLNNELSQPGSLVHFIEDVLDAAGIGICLDFGQANLDGDVVDAIESVSEHLLAVHAHDNRRRADEHLPPFDGTIDWPAALTALQKVGYDGTIVLELGSRGADKDTMVAARNARRKMERYL